MISSHCFIESCEAGQAGLNQQYAEAIEGRGGKRKEDG
jgi:hypothetical protein